MKKVLAFLHPRQHLLLSVFSILAILVGVKWYFIMVLICNSLMTNNVMHLFMCLLAFVYLLWRNVYSSPLPILTNGCLFLLLSHKSSLNILDPYQIYDFQIFPPILWIAFQFLDSVLCNTKVFNFNEVQFIYFFFCCLCFWEQKAQIPIEYFFLINYLFLAALGLRCCLWTFSSCGEWGLLFVAGRRLLNAVAFLVVEHRL